MSDVLVPLTSPVFFIGLEDAETIDLHGKYCELIKAYESVVEQRNDERKDARRRISAIQLASERLIAMQTASRYSSPSALANSEEIGLRNQQLEAKVKLLQEGMDLSRAANDELEQDLAMALEDGVRYRDSLAKMIEIRETEARYRAQEEALAKVDGGVREAAAEVTRLKREMSTVVKQLESERSENKLLANQVVELSAGHRAVNDEASTLRSQVHEVEREKRELKDKADKRKDRDKDEILSLKKTVEKLQHEVSGLRDSAREVEMRREAEEVRREEQERAQEGQSKGDMQSSMATIHDLEREIRELRAQLQAAQEEIKRLGMRVEGLVTEEARLQAFNDAIKASNVALKGSCDALKKDKEVWGCERDRLLEDLKGLELRNKELSVLAAAAHEHASSRQPPTAAGRPPRPAEDGSLSARQRVSTEGGAGDSSAASGEGASPRLSISALATPGRKTTPRGTPMATSPSAGPTPFSPNKELSSPKFPSSPRAAASSSATLSRQVATPAPNIPGWERGPPPETPEVDPEDWRLSIQQYDAAPPNTIQDFVLVNKRASTVNAIAIDALLRRHKASVTRIDLSYNYLRNSGVISLAYLFRSLPNLSHLDLGDNHIGDTGAAAVAESSAASTSLVTLALGGNRISDPGMAAIAAALPLCLSTLNCNFNCVGDEGASALASTIGSGNCNLTCLYLSGNKIAAQGIKALAGVITQEAKLKQMYLRGNPMDDECKTVLDDLAAHHPNLVLFV